MIRPYAAFFAATLMLAAPAFAQDKPAAAVDDKAPVARINGEAITRADMQVEAAQLPPEVTSRMPFAALYPQLLEQMIMERTVQQAGYKAGLENDAVVKQRLKEVEGKIVADEFLRREIKKRVTDDALKAAYEDYKKKFKSEDEVRASHILVKTEAQAIEIIKQLKAGGDFAKLAAEKSEDKAAAKQGGDLGYFRQADMVGPFSTAAFAMKPGDVSTKPVKTDFGYHVIKVVDKRASQPDTYEVMKPQLEAKISQAQGKALVQDLIGKSKVERFQIDGSPMAAPTEKATVEK